MGKDEILKRLKADKAKLTKFNIKRLALFGSIARGEEKPGSDIDILVEFEGRSTFDQYMKLRFYLEETFGSHVDLLTRKGIRQEILPAVEKEAIYVS